VGDYVWLVGGAIAVAIRRLVVVVGIVVVVRRIEAGKG
jgi:hypothetical protein